MLGNQTEGQILTAAKIETLKGKKKAKDTTLTQLENEDVGPQEQEQSKWITVQKQCIKVWVQRVF